MFQRILKGRPARNQLLDDPLWMRSIKAYRKYLKEPNPTRLRHVFEEMLNRTDIWCGAYARSSVFRDFDIAAAQADNYSAKAIAQSIIRSLDDPRARGAVRLVLAARAAMAHENVSLADLLLAEGEDDSPFSLPMQRLLLTMRSSTAQSEQLFDVLASNPGASVIAKEWIRARWLYEGPSMELIEIALKAANILAEQRIELLREGLALAFLQNETAIVRKLLTLCPELAMSYKLILPLAAYLRSSSGGLGSSLSTERAHIFELADLYDHLKSGTKSLVDTLRNQSITLAIVGNSPCELGYKRGPLIDSHDLVARFNLFSTDDKFVADYGQKCSIHVRRPAPEEYNSLSHKAGLTVLNWADLPYRLRRHGSALKLFREGVKLAGFPLGFHQPLYRELKAQPSAGLVFASLIKSVRGILPRESCFGFSFVDQIAETSAHYFQEARPSFKHRWLEERSMFERMTALGGKESDHK